MATEKITAKQLKNVVNDVRELIEIYMSKNDLSVHGVAVKCGVHPNQMYLFLNGDRGLNLTTVQKIGEVISQV